MSVRDMNGNPAVWEGLYWSDMSPEERELWTVLGWNEQIWDTQINVPATADMEWRALTDAQRKAASGLGWTEEMWNGFEDQ